MTSSQEAREALERLHDNLAAAPHNAKRSMVSLDDHRAILQAFTDPTERLTQAEARTAAAVLAERQDALLREVLTYGHRLPTGLTNAILRAIEEPKS